MGGIFTKCLSHLNWRILMWRNSLLMSRFLTLSLKLNPDTLQKKLIAPEASLFGSDPRVQDHRWWLECILSGKLRADLMFWVWFKKHYGIWIPSFEGFSSGYMRFYIPKKIKFKRIEKKWKRVQFFILVSLIHTYGTSSSTDLYIHILVN